MRRNGRPVDPRGATLALLIATVACVSASEVTVLASPTGDLDAPSTDCTAANGTTVRSGSEQEFFATATVPLGAECVSELRRCEAGVLSGSFTFSACVPMSAADCVGPDAALIPDGAGRAYYETASVPYGASCVTEERTCTNGNLDGGYTEPSCSVAAAADCTGPGGGVVSHAASRVYYRHAVLPAGAASCVSESRTCTNGTLSGSYTKADCTSCGNGECTAGESAVSCALDCPDTSGASVPRMAWYLWGSASNRLLTLYCGDPKSAPAAADWNGDGLAEPGFVRRYVSTLWRGPQYEWLSCDRAGAALTSHGTYGGPATDLPVPGDYDGDGVGEPAVVRPSGAAGWYLYPSGSAVTMGAFVPDPFFGALAGELAASSAVPAPADYDGDGETELGVYYPAYEIWSREGQGDVDLSGWAATGEVPIPADYDGDGAAELALWRRSDAQWIVEGVPQGAFGVESDIAVPADYDGDGIADRAVVRPNPWITFGAAAAPLFTKSGHASSVSFIRDGDGTYYLTWCGYPLDPFWSSDSVYHSWATSPTDGPAFSANTVVLSNWGCAVGVVKMPAPLLPPTVVGDTAGNGGVAGCNSCADVYLAYYESSGSLGLSSTWCQESPANLYVCAQGNTFMLSCTCNPKSGSWPRVSTNVLSIEPAEVQPSCFPNANFYGVGYPGPIFDAASGTLYMFYYKHTNNPDCSSGALGTYLATSTDGVNFTRRGPVGAYLSSRVRYLARYQIFVGVQYGSFFFSPDPLKLGPPFLPGHLGPAGLAPSLLTAPVPFDCHVSDGLLSNAYGVIPGATTVYVSGGWNSTPPGTQNNCDPSPASQQGAEIYAVPIQLD
ncbi:MAG: VCBS repeat-containing protein [Deltaproteobacteria bacterium]|nr:VCBS repeat-containing protein [Deltaproteobacteria bacterium]